MAEIAIQPAPAVQTFGFGSILSDAWDLAQHTFKAWVDDELGAEVPLAQEALRDQQRQAALQAPTPAASLTTPAGSFDLTTLGLVALAGLAAFLLLRR